MANSGSKRRATAEEDMNEPARPLALPSSSVHPVANDENSPTATEPRSMPYMRKRRCALLCCCGCATTAAIVGVVILVLALTVFRVRNPEMTMNSVSLTALRTAAGGAGGPAVAANATLTADVSIKNPNAASFRFSASETDVFYKGQIVSVAYAPGGRAGADRTLRMNLTVDLLGDRLARLLDGADLVFGQQYDLTTYTEVDGRVSVLGIIKKHVEIRMNCSISVQVGGAASVLVPGGRMWSSPRRMGAVSGPRGQRCAGGKRRLEGGRLGEEGGREDVELATEEQAAVASCVAWKSPANKSA